MQYCDKIASAPLWLTSLQHLLFLIVYNNALFSLKEVLIMTLIIRMLSVVLILSSCANQGLTDVERTALYQNYVLENKLEKVKSITTFRYNGWRELGKEHLIIFTSIRKPYLITLKGRCIDLRFSNTLGINHTGSTLHANFDSIFVTSFPEQKCFIKSIHRLTREQADQMSTLDEPDKEQSTEKQSPKDTGD